MERFIEEALLYDFYGELLTEHQKLIYEDFVLNDLSLSEIAEDREISRQGVYDIVRRCRKQLQASGQAQTGGSIRSFACFGFVSRRLNWSFPQ